MKALNSKEITSKYFIFLLNFTVLLLCTTGCYFLYLKADQRQSAMIQEQQRVHEYIFNARQELAGKIDTLNTYLSMLNTNQVENEVALERVILKLKNETSKKLEILKANGVPDHYILFDKIVSNVEKAIDYKHAFQQAMADEEVQKKRLNDCIEANNKVKKELIGGK
jgi:hypothetical protein